MMDKDRAPTDKELAESGLNAAEAVYRQLIESEETENHGLYLCIGIGNDSGGFHRIAERHIDGEDVVVSRAMKADLRKIANAAARMAAHHRSDTLQLLRFNIAGAEANPGGVYCLPSAPERDGWKDYHPIVCGVAGTRDIQCHTLAQVAATVMGGGVADREIERSFGMFE